MKNCCILNSVMIIAMKFFNKKTKNKKIGLALGGGAVLGADRRSGYSH